MSILAPTLAAWLQLVGVIALEIFLIAAAATLAGKFVRSASWKRTVWQVCLLGSLLLVGSELVGFREGMSGWLRAGPASVVPQSPPPALSPVLPPLQLVPRVEAVLPAAAVEFKEPEPVWQAHAAWWPGLVWLIGFALLAGRMVVTRLMFILFRHRRQRALNDLPVLERAQRLARRLGIRRQIRVTEMTGLRGPVVFGILQPCVGVPEGFSRDYSPAQQEVMLAHELAHVAARDPFWYALADLALTLLWWHPVAWWSRAQLRVASESAADEASLLVKNGPTVLAECLVVLGGRLAGGSSPGGIGVEGSDFRSGLGRRVKRLLGLSSQSWRPLGRMRAWLVTTLGPAFIVGVVVAATVWIQPGIARAGTVREAFWQSVLGLALTVALPADRGVNVANPSGNAQTRPDRIDWKPWSRAAVDEARTEGKAVLIHFTADWCVTGNANERSSLEIDSVRAKLRELGVVTLRADYTDADAAITEELQRFNRAGVPLLLVYPASSDVPPKVLPEVLTPQLVLDALDEATSPVAAKPTPKPEAVESNDPRNNAPKLILEGKALMDSGKLAEAEIKLRQALVIDPANNAAKQYLAQLQTQQERAGEAVKAQVAQAATNGLRMTNFVNISPGRRRIMQKLDSIVLDEVSFDVLALGRVIESLSREIKVRDPEGRGINFLITGGPAAEDSPATNVIIRVQSSLRNVTLRQILDIIVRCAEQPIRYSIEDYAIVFSLGSVAPRPLFTRWFKIDSRTFLTGIREMLGTNPAAINLVPTSEAPAVAPTPTPDDEVIADARRLFTRAGVDFTQPGKQLSYGNRLGMLMVRATLSDLDIIEQTIQVLNMPPPQVMIEVKFCEIDDADGKALGFDWMLAGTRTNRLSGAQPTNRTNPAVEMVTGILTDPQFRVVLRALEQRRGVNVLSAPKVTTLSGRQAQIKSVEVRYIVTGLETTRPADPLGQGSSPKPQSTFLTESFELGPVIDVVPYVQADGVTISMTVIPSIKEFIGYDLDSEKQIRKLYNSGDPKSRPTAPAETSIPLPIFRLRQIVASAVVWDGQTLVLSGGSMTYEQNGKTLPKDAGAQKGAARLFGGQKTVNRKKTLLVFVTPTLIDPAGNRVHSEDNIPFTKDSIPPQKPGVPSK